MAASDILSVLQRIQSEMATLNIDVKKIITRFNKVEQTLNLVTETVTRSGSSVERTTVPQDDNCSAHHEAHRPPEDLITHMDSEASITVTEIATNPISVERATVSITSSQDNSSVPPEGLRTEVAHTDSEASGATTESGKPFATATEESSSESISTNIEQPCIDSGGVRYD